MIKITFMPIFSVIFLFISFLGFGFAEESPETRLTQFDVFLSESDFTTQGPNHNILALNKGNSAEINVYVKNSDDVPHKVKLSSPRNSDSSTFSQFEFEPKEILVLPNKTNSTKLYLTISNQTTTHSTFVTFLGQSETFGMKGLGFYVVVDGDFQWVDYSLRAGLPGSAFPNLVTNISEKEAEKLIKNGLGTPEYLPNDYQFRGVMDGDESQLFVYSNSNISNQTESIEFSQEGGMTIFYNVKGPNVNNTKSLPFKVAQDEGQQIMINGFSGMVTEQTSRTVMYSNSTYKVPGDLYFFDDDKKFSVSVKGNLPLDEILKIAESINVETRHPCSNNENLPSVCTPEKSIEFYEFMGTQWMESKKQEMLEAMRENQFQEWIDQTQNHYHWNVYQYYSFTEDLANIRLHSSPHQQYSDGIEPDQIKCNFSFLKVQKYDGTPACVSVVTKQKLVERGWAKNSFSEVSDSQVIKYSPVLFKGTGVDLKGEELLALLKQKQDQASNAFDEPEATGLPRIHSLALSIGVNAYSLDEKYVGNPSALEIRILKDEFTKTNLEKLDQFIRKYIGEEIDIVYLKR